jgi:hypothetical protein
MPVPSFLFVFCVWMLIFMRTFAIVTADSGDGGSQYLERTGKSNHIQDHNTFFFKHTDQ